ncbi:MAG: NAD(P)/FAD-dependent oxidoreductase [Bacteroidota bacterium]
MKRSEFIHKSLAFGAGMSLFSLIAQSCEQPEDGGLIPILDTEFSGKVLIIGAGAAGMGAAYFLERNGIEYEVLEASTTFGGRVKRASGFADFPIDLGAEWLHADPETLTELVADPTTAVDVDLIRYRPQEIEAWNGNKLNRHNWVRALYAEYKFKSITWYGFFEKYFIPHIGDKIRYKQAVAKIDYTGDQVAVTTEEGEVFEADRVLITIPIAVLQQETIEFVPALPAEKKTAIQNVYIGDGIKVFIEFTERFYPDLVLTNGLWSSGEAAEHLFYDAAFRKEAQSHVLGLFTVGEKATPYTNLNSEEEIMTKIMAELDEMFDGKASDTYVQHVIQNWSKEPYIGGSYALDYEGDREDIIDTILAPVNNQLYFAGEALNKVWQSTVNGACESGYAVVQEMVSI